MSILRMRDVIRMTGLSRSTIYLLIDRGEFPKQIRLGARAVGWREADVLAWLEMPATLAAMCAAPSIAGGPARGATPSASDRMAAGPRWWRSTANG